MFPCVVMSNAIHAYISQSDRGELVIGAGTDQYVSYSQQGGMHIATHTLEASCELFPQFSRLRMLRNWGGIVDVTPDRSPIIGLTPIPGLYVNCGWGTGGFKATPGSGHVFAHTIAKGDSFYTLGKKYNVGLKAIADANPGVNPNRLKIGDKVKIPPPKTPSGASITASATCGHSA